MNMKWEFGMLAFVLLGAGTFMMIAEPINTQAPLERTDNFSKLDYDAFDRDFLVNGETCEVGIAQNKLCFKASPLQKQIAKGEALNGRIPVMAAEFPILVATPPKAQHQKLLRYGTTLVLINEDTKIIEDMIHLGETQA